ncbi:MAG TPA: hypothetical protein VFL83_12550 [Anaeromyxobacter sp.]|nr:hypothetical protein [Anaeromyxobacter sp.]
MTSFHSFRRAALATLLACALAPAPALSLEITYRSFSGSATMGPQAQAFAAKLLEVTTAAFGPGGEVRFTKLPGTPAVPGGDIVAAVGSGYFQAAYNSGSELNRAWGFIYNSGPPFGPNFDEHLGFLYGKSVATAEGAQITGLELMQGFLARRNVIAFPIVGSSEQLSGYFKKPLGDVPGVKGIGLAGLCSEPWKLRYLPPAENVLGIACDELVARGVIPVKNLSFVAAVPGGGSLVDGLKNNTIQGFEFATPLDDVSQVFNVAGSNPGTYGNRYVHLPGWQQQFLITWMIVNLDVWNSMSAGQQAVFKSVARDHVVSSYGENMRQQGAALKYILDVNDGNATPDDDMVLTDWPKHDQELLRDATIRFLNARAADPSFGVDGEEYWRILEAYRAYVLSNDVYWDDRGVNVRMRFDDWANAYGDPWTDPSRSGGMNGAYGHKK